MRSVVSLSGGKDSVALWLWARREGLEPVAVYSDTHWEWDGHYAHLDLLEARLGKIHRVGIAETFEEVVRRKKSFPSRVRKWCTEELKLIPFRTWLDAFREETGEDVQVLLGIRREESAARADEVRTPEREWSDFYDCEIWRPILDWTVEQVIREHNAAAIPMHPLYFEGAERVGCFPCVNAGKTELAVVGRLAPERVARIRALEEELGATMFTRDRRVEKRHETKKLLSDVDVLKALHADAAARGKAGDEEEADVARQIAALVGPSVIPIGIDEVMKWAQTAHGGKQIELVRQPTGCARWGICERPSK